MSIIENAKNVLTEVYNTGYSKAKEIKDTTKYTLDIKNVETTINQYYKEIGRAYFEKHRHDESFEFPQMAAIKNAFAERARLQALVDQARGIEKCPNCGKPVGDTDRFCSSCGEKLHEVVEGEVIRNGSNITMQPEDTADRIREGVRDFTERAADAASELKEGAKEAAKAFSENAEDVLGDAKEAADGISSRMSRNADILKTDASDAAGFVARKIAKGAEKLKDAAENFADRTEEKARVRAEAAGQAAAGDAAKAAETVSEAADTAAETAGEAASAAEDITE